MPSRDAILDRLLSESPSFHGTGELSQWSLPADVLRWLLRSVTSSHRTLETGCGYSTIVFALCGSEHVAISPLEEEHRRLVSWGASRGVDFSRVRLIAQRSEVALAGLGESPLDLVLIDGWHAFPGPILDWFHVCRRLAVGGRVVIDDTQIKSCRILSDFLSAEEGRWAREVRFNRTDVFVKLKADVFEGDWRSQPFGMFPAYSHRDRWVMTIRPRLVRLAGIVPGLVPLLRKVRDSGGK